MYLTTIARMRAILPLILLTLCAGSASAQQATVGVNQVRPTFADTAELIGSGDVQMESGYVARFYEGSQSTQQSLETQVAIGIDDMLEARLRWSALNLQGDETGVGDMAIGVKGGFLGGVDADTSLAAVFETQLPTGSEPFGIGQGVGLLGGMVATHRRAALQFDLQVAMDAILFNDDTELGLPLALGVVWQPMERVRIFGDLVERLDLTNLTESNTSVLAGSGYLLAQNFSVDVAARLGLSTGLPDVVVGGGFTWFIGNFYH